MQLVEILATGPKRKVTKRIGRGPGSGKGKTSGKGHKGQKSRAGKGARIRRGFEGGQMPLYRRLPKRGFNHVPKKNWVVLNVEAMNVFREGTDITPELLQQKGLIKRVGCLIKILGGGQLKKKFTINAHHFSRHAIEKIEKKEGKAQVIGEK